MASLVKTSCCLTAAASVVEMSLTFTMFKRICVNDETVCLSAEVSLFLLHTAGVSLEGDIA